MKVCAEESDWTTVMDFQKLSNMCRFELTDYT
jgi:hypothetical protein